MSLFYNLKLNEKVLLKRMIAEIVKRLWLIHNFEDLKYANIGPLLGATSQTCT